ncbi:MAG: DUF1801 domain-containing protein [Phycisphaerales bacterium]
MPNPEFHLEIEIPKPKLLSGGNPQIPKGEGDAPVQSYIDAIPGWKRDVGRRLDEIVTRAVPKVCKAVKWNSPFYGVELGRWFMSFHCFEKYVKVTFFDGAKLDPVPPETSKYENVKYAHIREGEAIDEKLWTKWIKRASKLPGEKL